MTRRPERRRLIDIIAEAALFGLICVISVVAFMFVRRSSPSRRAATSKLLIPPI